MPETWVSAGPWQRHVAAAVVADDDARLLRQLPLRWLPLLLGIWVAAASCAASLASGMEAMAAYAASCPCHTDPTYVAASYWVASSWAAAQTWDLQGSDTRYIIFI